MRIVLEDIHKSFGPVRANDGVDLIVEEGTIHGLLGENGAGKTTLMKVLSGYQLPDRGRILLDGEEVCFESPAEALCRGIGMLHQDPLDVPQLTVLENFMLGQEDGLLRSGRKARLALQELCQRFGFSLSPEERVASLTVGERQQLELVRLLALGVRVVILDEPTTGISAPQKIQLFRVLRELASEGLSVIFVSHKLEEIEELCGAATVLRHGRVTGVVQAPFERGELVRLMFGRSLKPYARPQVPLSDVVLELEDVSVQSGRLSLEHISIAVRAGEVIGLAGLEGSGQRLFMEVCAGLRSVKSGRISLGGRDMTNCSYHRFLRAGVSFVPAARLEEALIPGLTLREHFALAEPARSFWVNWPLADKIARQRIAQFNIIGRPDTRVEELSGGNQQRALLALLPPNLRLLILEHPTRGLDMGSVQWVWTQLQARRQQGTAILFTSTDLDELVENSDRILVFSGGRMSAPLSTRELRGEELGYLIGGVDL